MIVNTETRVGLFVLAALCVLAYMGFQIGAFRFDRGRYADYTLYFKDISGLSRKSDVKIAGVKVGWVDTVMLAPNDELLAEVKVKILKDYSLYSDSYALVRQDGLLGPKFIEINPGDPLLRKLASGDPLGRPSTEPVSIDELLQQFKRIATNVDDVTKSFKDVIGGPEGREQLQTIVNNIQTSVERISQVGEVLHDSFMRNEDHIDSFMRIGSTFQENVEKISNVFDRDFNRFATKFEESAGALEEASLQAREGLRSVASVAEKIDEGKGLLGKLINEDETYGDLKLAVSGFKNYLTKMDRMQIIFDGHSEYMIRRAEGFQWEDAKGFFNVRLYPREDYFYQLQIVATEKGYPKRVFREYTYYDANGREIDIKPLQDAPLPSEGPVDNLTRFALIFDNQKKTVQRDVFRIDLQFGKIFKDIALRIGLIEGTVGMGIDVNVPFTTNNLRWVSTFELWDINGRNRTILDRRPHMKWLNKMYIMRNLYATFGADDFVSQKNASVFFGGGFRFGDDDVKYIISSVSGAAGSSLVR